MLHRNYIPIEENKNSTQKDEHEFLYKKDAEIKGENFNDVDNKRIIEYGNDFLKM